MDAPDHFIMMPIPAASFTAVCALLGGAALAIGGTNAKSPAPAAASAAAGAPVEETLADKADAGPTGDNTNGETDAHGHPWSADLHASTQTKTKDGLWRMKVGVSRPDPKPGYPLGDTGTANAGTASPAPDTASAATAGAADDDEFAAFRAAADKSNEADAAAAAAIPARKWTDADLGALCNQAAVKLADPAPVKAIIAEHVPEGTVPHSRNIPDDKREAFAKAVEAKAGITFAG